MSRNQAYKTVPIALALAIACFPPTLAVAQQKTAPRANFVDFGKMEYEAKCASCHGVKGKGNGPAARFMTQKVPDLSTLTKRNDGILPADRMYEMITGNVGTPGPHGSREMPMWGPVYRVEGQPQSDERYDKESYARGRVLTLIEYINRIQVK